MLMAGNLRREESSAHDPRVAESGAMRIYRNPTILGAIDVLAANFPATRRFLGKDVFEAQALEYARACPPLLPVDPMYGHGLSDWLAARPIAAEMPLVRDVARCDELTVESARAPEAPILMPGELDIMPTSKVLNFRLRLHPAARFEWMSPEGMRIWQSDRALKHEMSAAQEETTGVLFTRQALKVRGYEISRAGHRLLAGIRMGEMLGAAAQAASRLYPQDAIAECFEDLVAQGAFAAPSKGR